MQWAAGENGAISVSPSRRDDAFGFARATDVIVSGGSAGGLAAFLHADAIAARLPASVARYGVAPLSGFFLDHATHAGAPRFAAAMAGVYALHNLSGGVNQVLYCDVL